MLRTDLLRLDATDNDDVYGGDLIEAGMTRSLGLSHPLWPSRAEEIEDAYGLGDALRMAVFRDLHRLRDEAHKARAGVLNPPALSSLASVYADAVIALLELNRPTLANEPAFWMRYVIGERIGDLTLAGMLRVLALIALRQLKPAAANEWLYRASLFFEPTTSHVLLDAVHYGQIGHADIMEEELTRGLTWATRSGWSDQLACSAFVHRVGTPPGRPEFDQTSEPA